MNFRLYTFVANHYLSPLQCGLQTAHVVSELSRGHALSSARAAFDEWAAKDKTIIICAAGNHQGVLDCHAELVRTGDAALGCPVALFREDEQSMNGMATACGVIVPECYWNVVFEDGIENGLGYPRWSHAQIDDTGAVIALHEYPLTHPEGQFVNHIKKYRLA